MWNPGSNYEPPLSSLSIYTPSFLSTPLRAPISTHFISLLLSKSHLRPISRITISTRPRWEFAAPRARPKWPRPSWFYLTGNYRSTPTRFGFPTCSRSTPPALFATRTKWTLTTSFRLWTTTTSFTRASSTSLCRWAGSSIHYRLRRWRHWPWKPAPRSWRAAERNVGFEKIRSLRWCFPSRRPSLAGERRPGVAVGRGGGGEVVEETPPQCWVRYRSSRGSLGI